MCRKKKKKKNISHLAHRGSVHSQTLSALREGGKGLFIQVKSQEIRRSPRAHDHEECVMARSHSPTWGCWSRVSFKAWGSVSSGVTPTACHGLRCWSYGESENISVSRIANNSFCLFSFWKQSSCAAQSGLEPAILLPLLPPVLDYRCMSIHLAF